MGKHADVTKALVSKHFPEIAGNIHFSNSYSEKAVTKAEICAKLGVELLVDDYEEHCKGCSERGIPSILLSKKWNEKADIPNTIRVNSWKEVLNAVDSISKGLKIN